MLQALRDHPQSQRLDPHHSLVAVLAVAQDARQGRHLGQPAAVAFALQLDL